MSDDARAAGAAAVTVVLWASAFVAIRSAGGHFAPGALALGRLLVASLALGVVWLLSGGGWPARAAWPGILCSGLLWFGLYMVTLNWGEREVDAGTAAMLVNIGPILLALLAGWLLHEGFPRRLAAGMAVSFGGAVLDCTMQSMMTICIHDRAHHPRRARRRRPHDEDSRGSVRPVFAGLPPQLD